MIVLDCSAVVDVLVGFPANKAALDAMSDDDVHAPSLLDYEVASALRGHCLGGKLSQVRLGEAIDDFASLQIDRHSMTLFLGHMMNLRNNFTVYDAAYVVLAQALDAPLVTADQNMLDAQRLGVDVRLVA